MNGRTRKRVFITGITGFVGRVLAAALRAEGRAVAGCSRHGDPGRSEVFACDLARAPELGARMREFAPDAVVHLAAVGYVPDVWADPVGSARTNVGGALSVLDAAREAAPQARVLLVSSGLVYGEIRPEDLPLREDTPLRPEQPYAQQKLAVEIAGARARERGQDVVVARPFNHVGRGMNPKVSLMHFARALVGIERGAEPRLRVGNLSTRRDFLDVRDVVEAYRLLLDHPAPPPILNVCSGEAVEIRAALDALIEACGLEVAIETDPARMRKLDTPEVRGDPTLARETLGWRRLVPFGRTLADILDEARASAEESDPDA